MNIDEICLIQKWTITEQGVVNKVRGTYGTN